MTGARYRIGDAVRANGQPGVVTATPGDHATNNYVPEGMLCVRLPGGEAIVAQDEVEAARTEPERARLLLLEDWATGNGAAMRKAWRDAVRHGVGIGHADFSQRRWVELTHVKPEEYLAKADSRETEMTKTYKAFDRETGAGIVGALERVICRAAVTAWGPEGPTDYGETKLWYEATDPVTDERGVALWSDDRGNDVPEDRIDIFEMDEDGVAIRATARPLSEALAAEPETD